MSLKEIVLSFVQEELHIKRVCFFHYDWKAFSYTPWLPYKKTFQGLYVAYRWILALFYFFYSFVIGFEWGSVTFFLYLTHLVFLNYTVYLLWSAVVVTCAYLQIVFSNNTRFNYAYQSDESRSKAFRARRRPGGCIDAFDAISWYHKIQWFLFVTGVEMELFVLVMFWSFLYPSHPEAYKLNDYNLVAHFVSGVTAYVDVWVTGIPVYVWHAIYLVLYGSLYGAFTGIHHVAFVKTNITGPIYSQIDYEENPISGAVTVVLIVLLALPVCHMVFYLSYLGRKGCLKLIKKYCCKVNNCYSDKSLSEEGFILE